VTVIRRVSPLKSGAGNSTESVKKLVLPAKRELVSWQGWQAQQLD
jgi:hypothetical protein